MNVAPSAYRVNLSYPQVIKTKRGKSVYPLAVKQESKPQGMPIDMQAEDVGGSERHFVTKWIWVETLSESKDSRLPTGA